MKHNDLEDVNNLFHITHSLVIYRHTIAFIIGQFLIEFIIIGSIIFLIFLFPMQLNFLIFIVVTSSLIIALGIYSLLFANILKRFDEVIKYEGLLWIACFSIPFIFGYFFLPKISPIFDVWIIWYPILGIANILAGILIERVYYTRGDLFAIPYLFHGILLIISSFVLFGMKAFIQSSTDLFIISIGFLLIVSVMTIAASLFITERRVISK